MVRYGWSPGGGKGQFLISNTEHTSSVAVKLQVSSIAVKAHKLAVKAVKVHKSGE